MEPTAAPAANDTPWSRARKNATGPDVSGNPTSQPLTPGPHRRPARLTAPIKVGVSTSLSARPSTTPKLIATEPRAGPSRRTGRYRSGAGGGALARDAQNEAPTLVAELDALFLDLFDPEAAIDRVAFAVPAPVDEDHSFRRRVGIDQCLEPEPCRLRRRRLSGCGGWRRRCRRRGCRLDRRGPRARGRRRSRWRRARLHRGRGCS